MFPISVEARAKINVTFLHDPLFKSFAVTCRFWRIPGAAAVARPAMADITAMENFILNVYV
jgi:hypothetical protein